ncbi:MAG: AAA family ATPase [Spirosomataceae bacterium]
MEHFIKNIEISNFKSFKHLQVEGFKRINLFIGKPNVGKSNFLEALGLFSVAALNENDNFNELLRFESPTEIFYDLNIKDSVSVIMNDNKKKIKLYLIFNRNDGIKIYESFIHNAYEIEQSFQFGLNNLLNHKSIIPSSYILNHYLKYNFNPNLILKTKEIEEYSGFGYKLLPPTGTNIAQVLELLPNLRKTFESWFNQYGLRLVLDKTSQSLKIMKDKGDEGVFLLPYSSIADTLQRIIFYKTAIASNENSVLIFEEPEAHAFPPYIAEFTRDVINSTTNQFFIATHSPFILNDFLEDAREELAIYIVDFKDGQTVMKGLSREEIEEVYKYGVDLFFNYESYLA